MATALQAQVDDSVRVMRENIDKVSQREERLDSLQGKTDNLAVQSEGLRRDAKKARKRMCWKDIKSRMCLIGAVVILLLVMVVLPIVALILQHHK
jgi:vesicle-associated membrane protein 4